MTEIYLHIVARMADLANAPHAAGTDTVACSRAHPKQVLFVSYEEMCADVLSVVRRVSTFLGCVID